MNIDAIPQELRDCEQWVAYKIKAPRKPVGKPGKIPVNPATGRHASVTDPSTWGTFELAVERQQMDELSGVGFVFTEDSSFAGVDLDDCRNPESGEVADWAQAIVEQISSYTEISPSGTGIHVIAKGALPPGGRRTGKVEMYDAARFFTMTGERVPETPADVRECTKELGVLHAEFFGFPEAEDAANLDVSDEDLIERAMRAGNGDKFCRLWRGDHSTYESQSEADLALCGIFAFWTGGDAHRIDRLFRRSKLMREKWDQKRGRHTYGQRTVKKALAGKSEFYEPEKKSGKGSGESIASQLVSLVAKVGLELLHDPRHEAYGALDVDGHMETWRLRDRDFQRWLSRLYYTQKGKVAASNSITDAIRVLEGKALFEGPERDVYVRLASFEDRIIIDLGGPDWSVVEVSRTSWRVLAKSPVHFRRPSGMKPLPMPVGGGSLRELDRFLNCSSIDRPLILGWLVAALRPHGPYVVLILLGEQGSAKSTTARVLRRVVDPNAAPLRAAPRDGRDLAITASNGWVLTFDNLSNLPDWLSDAFCRIATGGGFATRTLYTDDEETIFDAQRPIVLTGIEDIVGRSDLLDRAVIAYAPAIPDRDRVPEEKFWADFEKAWPRIFGAILDVMVEGLRQHTDVKLTSVPRMADFARWAVACEAALGLGEGEFLEAYEANRQVSVDLALEASPVAQAVRGLMEKCPGGLKVTATDLLDLLNKNRGDEKPPRTWPKTAKGLSGALRRAAPDLREVGIDVEFGRDEGRKRMRWIRLTRVDDQGPGGGGGPQDPQAPHQEAAGPEPRSSDASAGGGGCDASADASAEDPSESPSGGVRTHPDASDASQQAPLLGGGGEEATRVACSDQADGEPTTSAPPPHAGDKQSEGPAGQEDTSSSSRAGARGGAGTGGADGVSGGASDSPPVSEGGENASDASGCVRDPGPDQGGDGSEDDWGEL